MVLLVPLADATAQEQTLLKDGIQSGGFGGIAVKFTEVNNQFGVLVGIRGGWIINHTFVVGAGGYGLANEVESDFILDDVRYELEFGYGGLELTYINNSNRLIHFTLGALIGGGAADYRDPADDSENLFDDGDAVFVLEPEVNLVLNIHRNIRMGAGGGYRFVTGVDAPGLENGELAGPSGHIQLKFGSF